MMYARIAMAKATSAAGAANNAGAYLECETFTGTIGVFEKFLSASPTTGNLRQTPQDETIFNTSGEAIEIGDFVQVGLQIDETWVVITGISGSGGSGGSSIIFEIAAGGSGSEEAASNDCDDKLQDAGSSYVAHVRYRPCGVDRVPEETDAGTVVVHDELGSFLNNRENSEAEGKLGVATYFQQDGGYCLWVITFIDWWREIQVITDVLHTDSEIRFKVKQVKVWDDCDLPDIVIPLIDCEEAS